MEGGGCIGDYHPSLTGTVMDEWHLTANTLISILSTSLAGVCVYILKRFAERLDKLDSEAVRKRELKELEERIEEARRWMHAQNQSKLDSIQSSVTGTNKRIDEMFVEIISRPGGGR